MNEKRIEIGGMQRFLYTGFKDRFGKRIFLADVVDYEEMFFVGCINLRWGEFCVDFQLEEDTIGSIPLHQIHDEITLISD